MLIKLSKCQNFAIHYLVECGKAQRHCLHLHSIDFPTPYRPVDHYFKYGEHYLHAHLREVLSHLYHIMLHLNKESQP